MVPRATVAAEATPSRRIQINPVETEEDVDNPDAVDPTQDNSDPLNIEIITHKTPENDSRNCGTPLGRSKIIEEVVNKIEDISSGDLDDDQEEIIEFMDTNFFYHFLRSSAYSFFYFLEILFHSRLE